MPIADAATPGSEALPDMVIVLFWSALAIFEKLTSCEGRSARLFALMLVHAKPLISAEDEPSPPVVGTEPDTAEPFPPCAITTPSGVQRMQPVVLLLATFGTVRVKPPQNSKLFPPASLPRSGNFMFTSYESLRSPRHTVRVALVIPLPSIVTLPAVPSRRAHVPSSARPP